MKSNSCPSASSATLRRIEMLEPDGRVNGSNELPSGSKASSSTAATSNFSARRLSRWLKIQPVVFWLRRTHTRKRGRSINMLCETNPFSSVPFGGTSFRAIAKSLIINEERVRCLGFGPAARRECFRTGTREYPWWIFDRRATPPPDQRPATLRAAYRRASGGVAPQSQGPAAMLLRRALPDARR